jgi:hypothetical protein
MGSSQGLGLGLGLGLGHVATQKNTHNNNNNYNNNNYNNNNDYLRITSCCTATLNCAACSAPACTSARPPPSKPLAWG